MSTKLTYSQQDRASFKTVFESIDGSSISENFRGWVFSESEVDLGGPGTFSNPSFTCWRTIAPRRDAVETAGAGAPHRSYFVTVTHLWSKSRGKGELSLDDSLPDGFDLLVRTAFEAWNSHPHRSVTYPSPVIELTSNRETARFQTSLNVNLGD